MDILLATQSARTQQMLENAFKTLKISDVTFHVVADPDAVTACLGEDGIALVDWEGDPRQGARMVWTIRQNNPDAAVMLLCLKANKLTARIGIEAGAVGLVYKPVDPPGLLKAIANASARQQARSKTDFAVEDIPDRDMAIVRVRGHLDHGSREAFRAAIKDLLASPREKRVIDLSKTDYVSSLFFGTLLDLGDQAQNQGRPLSVLMGSKVARIGQQIGLPAVMTVVAV